MNDLKFTSLATQGEVLSTTNRNFTMTEEADISCYKANDIKVEFFNNAVWLTTNGDDVFSVHLFAVGDNLYVAHQNFSTEIYLTDNLKDCLDTAVEMIYQA